MAKKALLSNRFQIGEPGISLQNEGYIATLCIDTSKPTWDSPDASYEHYDIHLSRQQLERLRESIDNFLKHKEQN